MYNAYDELARLIYGCNPGLASAVRNKPKAEPEKKTDNRFQIHTILANHKKNAFTVAWADGTHTVIHLQEGDTWDNEKALAMCFVKKLMGNKGSFNDIFTEEMPKKLKEIPTETPAEKSATIKEAFKDATESTTSAKAKFNKLASAIAGLEEKTFKVEEFHNVYLTRLGGNRVHIGSGDKREVGKIIHEYIKNHYPTLVGTPQRLWNNDSDMYMDFGSTNLIIVEDMDADTWLTND